ncbi:MAG TPA: hypothetical protein VNT76_17280, partial [Candidatus Binatus sp.]|nr:hypothetical protein [Candidatus Binatus sp.]
MPRDYKVLVNKRGQMYIRRRRRPSTLQILDAMQSVFDSIERLKTLMKTKYPGLLLLFIAFILSTASIARAQTPPPPAPPAETATQSILDILSHSNLVAATYATADLS